MSQLLWWVFASVAIGGAIGTVTRRSPIASLLFLVVSFFSVAAIYVILGAHFIAAVQVIVYAGAILVLFLFVIMLLNLRAEVGKPMHIGVPQLLGVAIAVGILAQLISVFFSAAAKLGPLGEYSGQRVAEEGSLAIVGKLLLTEYVVPFEIISVLLMIAVMGAVVLAKRRPQQHVEEGS